MPLKSSHMMTMKGIIVAAVVASLLQITNVLVRARDVEKERNSYLNAPIHWPKLVAKRWKNRTMRNVYPAGRPSGSPTGK